MERPKPCCGNCLHTHRDWRHSGVSLCNQKDGTPVLYRDGPCEQYKPWTNLAERQREKKRAEREVSRQ